MSKLNAALAWARRGFRCFPLQVNSKDPLAISWTLHATTDEAVIRGWWTDPVLGIERDQNIGVLTDGLVVADIDVKDCKAGLATAERLGLRMDETLTIRTPSGGYHLYFKAPAHPVGQSPLGVGVDVRADHGYVLAPGSTIDGKAYTVEIDQPVIDFPEHLRHLLKVPRRRADVIPADVELDTPEVLEVARDYLRKQAPPAIEGMNGDDTAYKVACRLRDLGISESMALELFFDEYSERCSPPWSLEEAHLKIGNAYRYATGAVGALSPAAVFGHVVRVEFPTRAPVAAPGAESMLGSAAPSGSPHRTRFKNVDGFCAEYQPLAYVVEPILRTGAIYTLTAKTGGGKTGFNVITALAVATGRSDILGMDVACGRVAYCAFENPDDVRMRIIVSAGLLGIALSDIADKFIILDARTTPEDLLGELRASGEEGEFALVIVDTFAAAFDGRDVNDNVQTGEFVRRLRPVTQMAGTPALLVAAHPTKNASEDQLVPYGGGAILNEVDGNLTLAKQPDGGTVLHWQGKFRGLEFSRKHFRFEIVESREMRDSKGRNVALPVLRPAIAGAPLDRDMAVLLTLAATPAASSRCIGKATGISKSAVGRQVKILSAKALVEQVAGEWHVTRLGMKKLNHHNDLGEI